MSDEECYALRDALDGALDHAARTLHADYEGYKWYETVQTTSTGLVVWCYHEPPETWNKIRTRCGLNVEWKVVNPEKQA